MMQFVIQVVIQVKIKRNVVLTFIAIFAVCSYLNILYAAQESRSYPCYRSQQLPKLDGDIASDLGWQGIPGATGFYRLGGGYTEAKQTIAFATWDDEALYVGMECEEPDIGEVKSERKDGDDLWLEDSIEIFIHPDESPNVFQFIVNTIGARRGAESASGNLDWEAAAGKGKANWAVEVKLPFKMFGRTPKPGDVWTFTLCRNIFVYTSDGDKFTCWAPLKGRFLEPENFARMVFEGKALSAQEAKKVEAELNRPYRLHLTQQLTQAGRDIKEYAEVIERAVKDEEFEKEATSLKQEWQTIQRILQQVETAPIKDIRSAVRNLHALRQRSYQLKYKVLFKELFEQG